MHIASYPQGDSDRIISDIKQRQVLLENETVLRQNQHAGEIIDESQSTNTNVLGGISCEMDIAYFNGYVEVIAVCFPSKFRCRCFCWGWLRNKSRAHIGENIIIKSGIQIKNPNQK